METFRFFKYFNSSDEYPDLSHLVLYSSAENLNDSHLRPLQASRVILVIDDCSVEKAKKFQEIVSQKNSKLSLLTIGYNDDPYIFGHKVQLKPDKEITRLMLSKNSNIQSDINVINKLNEITSGFPLMAYLLEQVPPGGFVFQRIF